MTTVSAPYFDNARGRVVDRQSVTPWTVRVRTGNEVRFHRFRFEEDAQKFYESHAVIQSVKFRDSEGRSRYWKHARVVLTRDGKNLLVTRVKPNGDLYKSSNQPLQYTVLPEALVQSKQAA